MTNADLILILGVGVLAAGLALAIPGVPQRPVWLPQLLGVVAAVCGLLSMLLVLLR